MCIFARGQISRADRCKNLQDGRAVCIPYVSFSAFGGGIFRGLQMGVKNGAFFTVYLRDIVVAMCHKHDH